MTAPSDNFAASPSIAVVPWGRKAGLWALVSVALVVVLVFLLPENLVLTGPDSNTDTSGQFAAWRSFAADNIRAGHFPLWNPYTYAGQPFLGDFMSAELYPPNVIFLFLPLGRALNLSCLLHLLILGWGMAFWAGRRGYHPLACALCGLTLALSGPVFLRLYSGHIPFLSTLAWVPWMFAALEAAWRGPARRPLLLASVCICLQILGGGEQYVFYAAIAAGLHALVQTIMVPVVRRRALPLLALAYLLALPLAAMQLLPGLAAVSESVRNGKMAFDFINIFPFPPENLLTLVAPGFFGHLSNNSYWGRACLWEMSLFAGVSGLALAGLALGDRVHRRAAWMDFALIPPLFVLALGDHTPVLHFLYDYFPGFGSFRCQAKFIFPLVLFGVLLLGAGADALIRGRCGARLYAWGLLLAGVGCSGAGVVLWQQPGHLTGLLRFIQESHKSYVPNERYGEASFIHDCGVQAGQSLAQGGAILLLVGLALLLARSRPDWRWMPLAVLPLEMAFFMQTNLGFADLTTIVPPEMTTLVASQPGDYRVLDFPALDNGYLLGKSDIWGSDPTPLKRYAEFVSFTQRKNPDLASQEIVFYSLPPIYSLLRLQFAFAKTDKFIIYQLPNPLPQALLVSDYRVLPDRDAIFAELAIPDFNPRLAVFLESEPSPRPEPAATPGTVKVTEVNGDLLDIEADTPAPAILLITDLYSRDWQARPLAGSVQQHYDLLPGDYILRAIPLEAGHHHLAVEYNPPSLRTGLIISAVAWLMWIGLIVKTKLQHKLA
jgi:hypothetical protein